MDGRSLVVVSSLESGGLLIRDLALRSASLQMRGTQTLGFNIPTHMEMPRLSRGVVTRQQSRWLFAAELSNP